MPGLGLGSLLGRPDMTRPAGQVREGGGLGHVRTEACSTVPPPLEIPSSPELSDPPLGSLVRGLDRVPGPVGRCLVTSSPTALAEKRVGRQGVCCHPRIRGEGANSRASRALPRY